MPVSINVGPRKSSDILGAVGTAANGIATVAGAVNGAKDLLNKLTAAPSIKSPTNAEDLAKTAMPESKPLQSDVGGSLGDAMTRRYKAAVGIREAR
jgi:hypothetical protein